MQQSNTQAIQFQLLQAPPFIINFSGNLKYSMPLNLRREHVLDTWCLDRIAAQYLWTIFLHLTFSCDCWSKCYQSERTGINIWGKRSVICRKYVRYVFIIIIEISVDISPDVDPKVITSILLYSSWVVGVSSESVDVR